MAVYQVQFINPTLGLNRTIPVPDDQYILDMAEEAGIRLPSACKQGECSACVAKLISGEIDQGECQPASVCTLETHQEQILYKSALYYQPEFGKSKRSQY